MAPRTSAPANRPKPSSRDSGISPVGLGSYQPKTANLILVAGIFVAGMFASFDLSDHADGGNGGPYLSWRIPIVIVLVVSYSVRCHRRGVVVTTAWIEGRQVFWTWRLPWSAVESVEVFDERSTVRSRLKVTVIDGSLHCAFIRPGRTGDSELAAAVSTARATAIEWPGSYADGNGWLFWFMCTGVALGATVVGVETGLSTELVEREQPWHRATLTEIGTPGVIALTVATIAVGVLAIRSQRRQRGSAPTGPWPARLVFPDGSVGAFGHPHPLDVPQPVRVTRTAVFTADGVRIGAISRRSIPGTPVTLRTFWLAPGEPAFKVYAMPRIARPNATATLVEHEEIAAQTDATRTGFFETGDHRVFFYDGDQTVAELVGKPRRRRPSDTEYSVVAIGGENVANVVRRPWLGWACTPTAHIERNLWRSIMVSTFWAEGTWQRNRPGD